MNSFSLVISRHPLNHWIVGYGVPATLKQNVAVSPAITKNIKHTKLHLKLCSSVVKRCSLDNDKAHFRTGCNKSKKERHIPPKTHKKTIALFLCCHLATFCKFDQTIPVISKRKGIQTKSFSGLLICVPTRHQVSF